MYVKDILLSKGSQVYSVSSDATLADVVASMVDHQCGSMIVKDSAGRLIGIVTERDILRISAKDQRPLAQIPLVRSMTREVVTASPQDRVCDMMGLMTERRFRHVPVVDRDELVGIISIGDVVKAHHAELLQENELLKEYLFSH